MQPRTAGAEDAAPAPRVSSTLILDQMELISALHGRPVVDRALASLDPDVRRELAMLMRGDWCSVETARLFKTAVARVLGEAPLAFQQRIVRIGLERTLGSVWRVFLSLISDARLSQGATLIYSRSFDRGKLRLVELNDGGCDLELSGWPAIDDFDLAGLAAGVEGAFGLANRKNVQVATERSGAVVHLRAAWTR